MIPTLVLEQAWDKGKNGRTQQATWRGRPFPVCSCGEPEGRRAAYKNQHRLAAFSCFMTLEKSVHPKEGTYSVVNSGFLR